MIDRVYKHCSEKHHPKNSGTIRVGTLSNFRSIENSAVKDEKEGRFSFNFLFNNTIVNPEWILDVTLGTYFKNDGAYAAHNLILGQYHGRNTAGSVYCTDELSTEKVDQGRLKLNGRICMEFDGADAFVFCVSANPEVGSVIDDFSYNSRWEVASANFSEFERIMGVEILNYIAAKLADAISKETVGPVQHPGFRSPDFKDHPNLRLGIASNFAEVQYRDKDIKINQDDKISRSEIENLIENSDYIKPENFDKEKEYRFLFRPVLMDDEKFFFIPNVLNPLFIKSESLIHLLR